MNDIEGQRSRLGTLGVIVLAMVPTVLLITWYLKPWGHNLPADSAGVDSAVVGPAAPTGPPSFGSVAAADDRDGVRLPHPGSDAVGTGAGLTINVSYQGDVTALPGAALVYLFIREPGNRMPLAVERREPGTLPIQVSFKGEALARSDLEVVARLTMDGGVRLQPGDVEVSRRLDPADLAREPLRLVLPAPAG